ncbi:cytochrome P450 [Streptomyces katrae]|uniref:Cytochrome P450 n=1 Tax=Streptomyces katrae TaxID=68223 RepID=A0ABT7GQY1_9ACTN|nr:cytochrome P450 [Streptomyces katrae]MDK9496014.1 cytochrome P450 [Streptomyces katrae]
MTEPVAFPEDRTCPYHPPAAYDPLRGGAPLKRVRFFDGRSVWAVTGHAAARALLGDPRLSSDSENEAFPVPSERYVGLLRRRTPLLGVDDPEHNRQRRLLIPSFTLKRTHAVRPRIQEIVDQLIDDMVAKGPKAELVGDFALPMPSKVICSMLGVPYEDHAFFEEQSRRLLRGPELSDVEDARDRLEDYLRALIEAKQAEPGEGMLDDIIREQTAEGEFDAEELAGLAFILLIAGHETTANMVSLGAYTLLEHPERLAELRADPSLVPAVVEELMRYLSIVEGMLRVAVEDIEIAGETIRKDDGVVFSLSLVNRDESVYPRPDVLDWQRSARHHVGFGFGIHQCLGQNLARAEMEIALGTLITRLPGLRLDAPAQEIPFKPGDTIQGIVQLPVAW